MKERKKYTYDMLGVWSRFIHARISQHSAILHKLHAERLMCTQCAVRIWNMEYVLAIGIVSLNFFLKKHLNINIRTPNNVSVCRYCRHFFR